MISNFDGEPAPGAPDDPFAAGFDIKPKSQAEIPPSPDESLPAGLDFMHKIAEAVKGSVNVLSKEDKAFATKKPHHDAIFVLKRTSVDEFQDWFLKRRAEGLVPEDWPAIEVYVDDHNQILPKDWPAFVVITALIHTGNKLTMLPKSYTEVEHLIWEHPDGVVLSWDGLRNAARLSIGNDKDGVRNIHAAAKAGLIVPTRMSDFTVYMPPVAMYRGMKAALANPCEQSEKILQAMHVFTDLQDRDRTGDIIEVLERIWVACMIRQLPSFDHRRCAVLVATHDGSRKWRLCHMVGAVEDFEPCVYNELLRQAVAGADYSDDDEEGGPAVFVGATVEGEEAFRPFADSPGWAGSIMKNWLLSPKALDQKERLLRRLNSNQTPS